MPPPLPMPMPVPPPFPLPLPMPARRAAAVRCPRVLRRLLPLVLLAGCRQILGLDPAQVAPADAPPDSVPVDEPGPRERKRVITISPSSPISTFKNFPLWFAIEDRDLAERARADGADIYFRASNGQPLVYEIQRWDPTTGRLEAWVQTNADYGTTFELRYGDAGVHTPGNVFTVAGGFTAVWHLEDTFATPAVVDAVGATPTSGSGLSAANHVAAILGGGVRLTDVSQRIQFLSSLTGNTSHTISAWVKLDAPVSYDPIVVLGNPSMNNSRWIHARYTGSETLGFGMYGNDRDTGMVLPQGTWTAVHWVYDSSNRTSRIFVNGALVTTFGHGNGVNTMGATGYIGFAPMQWGPNLNTETGMNGTLDEVRIQNVARADSWVAADVASQSAPDTTYSIGPEEVP